MDFVKLQGPDGSDVFISRGGEGIIEQAIGGAPGAKAVVKTMVGDVFVRQTPEEAAKLLQSNSPSN